jgi:hypothetical protein
VVLPAQPESVCIAQMWEFGYKKSFKYILSKFSSGITKQAASVATPTYSIAIETVPDSKYFQGMTPTHFAANFGAKVLDIVGRFDPRY